MTHTRIHPTIRKTAAYCVAALLLFIASATLVHAVDPVADTALGFSNPLQADSIEELLTDILQLVSRLGAIIAVLYFIYGGFLYVTAQGDEDKIGKAHSTLKWAAVGTAVLLGAEIIARIIETTVQSVSNL